MIVDTMTYTELNEYLWHTVFSNDSINAIEAIYRRKQKQYSKLVKEWERKPKKEKFIIFKPITYKGKNDERLVGVPYSNDSKYMDFVYFVKFRYRGRKYVAMKLVLYKKIIIYSWHSLERYAERFLEDKDAVIDDVFIGDMLIYNAQFMETKYYYKGKDTIMCVTTDGAFLCEKFDDICYVARTFISKKDYFNNQDELDKKAIITVNNYRKAKYNDTIDRTDI